MSAGELWSALDALPWPAPWIAHTFEFWVLLWRGPNKEDWGWLRSLDGDEDCTTVEPAQRLLYSSKAAAFAARWEFIRDNDHREDETVRVVHVRVKRTYVHKLAVACKPSEGPAT